MTGVGSFGVREGFPDVSFHSSAACFGSLASLAVFKQFSRAVGALRCTGRPGMGAPEPHFQADGFFFLIGALQGVSFEGWALEPNSICDNSGDGNNWSTSQSDIL